jgi:hypothetical protein
MRLRRAAVVIPMCLAFVAAMGGVASAKTYHVKGTYYSKKCIKLYDDQGAVPSISWNEKVALATHTLTLSSVKVRANSGGDCTAHESQSYAPKITLVQIVTLVGVSFGGCKTSFDISWPPGVNVSCSNGGTSSATFTAKLPCHTPKGASHGLTHCTFQANQVPFTLSKGKLLTISERFAAEYFNKAGDEYELETPS